MLLLYVSTRSHSHSPCVFSLVPLYAGTSSSKRSSFPATRSECPSGSASCVFYSLAALRSTVSASAFGCCHTVAAHGGWQHWCTSLLWVRACSRRPSFGCVTWPLRCIRRIISGAQGTGCNHGVQPPNGIRSSAASVVHSDVVSRWGEPRTCDAPQLPV